MSVRYLTDEWFSAVLAAAADLPVHPGRDCVIDVEVAGAAAGKVRYHEVWVDGRLVSAEVGKAAVSDVQFSLKYPDARALVGGEIDADVAFMQGRLKIDGAYERWLYRFRSVRTTDGYGSFLAAVAGLTDFD